MHVRVASSHFHTLHRLPPPSIIVEITTLIHTRRRVRNSKNFKSYPTRRLGSKLCLHLKLLFILVATVVISGYTSLINHQAVDITIIISLIIQKRYTKMNVCNRLVCLALAPRMIACAFSVRVQPQRPKGFPFQTIGS